MYTRQLLFNIVPISAVSLTNPNVTRRVNLPADAKVVVKKPQVDPVTAVTTFQPIEGTHQLPADCQLAAPEVARFSVETLPETATKAAAVLDSFSFAGKNLNDLVLNTHSPAYQASLQVIQNKYDTAKLQLAQKGQKFSNVEVRYLNANGVFNAMNYIADDLPDIRTFSGGYDGSSNGLRTVEDAQQSFVLIPFLEGTGILRQTKVIDRAAGTGTQDINFVMYALSTNPLQPDPSKIVINPLDPGAAPIRAAKKLAEASLKGFIGPETEFFLKDPETGAVVKGDMFEAGVNTFYASNSDDNVFAPFFAKLADAMDEAGILRDGPMHTEVAEGQLEVTRKYFAIERSDVAENMYRSVLKNTARLCGFEVELGAFPLDASKPNSDAASAADVHLPNASGMHMNTSLLRLDGDGEYQGVLRDTAAIGTKENPTNVLSEDGARYIQGGLEHMAAMTVITNPDVGQDLKTSAGEDRFLSHDRLGKNEAPGQVGMVLPYVGSAEDTTETHSGRNRTVPMNITLGSSTKSDRVEFRLVDPTENNYEGTRTNGATMGEKAAATVMAGFAGIQTGTSDVTTLKATYEDLYSDTEAAKALPQLPKTAQESYNSYNADGYLHTGKKATIHPARMAHILARTKDLGHLKTLSVL